jgi:hypothetical protein
MIYACAVGLVILVLCVPTKSLEVCSRGVRVSILESIGALQHCSIVGRI